MNHNTDWLSGKGVWTGYVSILVAAWLVFCAATDPLTALTALNVLHFSVTFYVFHWWKGTPIPADQGQYDDLTFWEQVDEGVQLTKARKFFTAVPCALFLLVARDDRFFVFNLALTVMLLFPKMPFMHKVRLLGINK